MVTRFVDSNKLQKCKIEEIFTGIFWKIFVLVGIREKFNTWQKMSRTWNPKSRNSAEDCGLSKKQNRRNIHQTIPMKKCSKFRTESQSRSRNWPLPPENAWRPLKQLCSCLMHFSRRLKLKTVPFLAKKLWKEGPRPPLDQVRFRVLERVVFEVFPNFTRKEVREKIQNIQKVERKR